MLPFNLPPPAGYDTAPVWTGRGFRLDAALIPVLEYSENFAGWSDDLTTLHEEAAGDAHPIDLASRADAVRQLTQKLAGKTTPTILEIGCSSGFLLRDISRTLPNAVVVGADVVKAPLYKLAEHMPQTPLLRFDLLQCPLPAASFDAIVLLNVLEHIEDDARAMQQLYRLLKPGGVAIIEVPAGPHLYDAYDKALMHFRRYGKAELLEKLEGAGFAVMRKSHLGCLVYPAFAHVKRRNQKAPPQDLQGVVEQQAHSTGSNLLMKTVMAVEMALGRYVSYPVGIRCLVTVRKTINEENKWPKRFAPLTVEQQTISNDFMKYWHEVLPCSYDFVDRFNHNYVVKNAPENFLRTLEIGAGTGEHLSYEKLTDEQANNYVAVDIRNNMVAEIRKACPNIQAIVADCQRRIDYPDEHFDRILAIHVLEHLPDLPAAIAELYRLCDKTRGVLSIVIPCEGGGGYSLARKISAQRIFEKRYKQSYQWFIEREHINRPAEIFEELAPYFKLQQATYFPLPIKSVFFNLCIGATLEPK